MSENVNAVRSVTNSAADFINGENIGALKMACCNEHLIIRNESKITIGRQTEQQVPLEG